jgi:lysophospholipase L1-like esterase
MREPERASKNLHRRELLTGGVAALGAGGLAGCVRTAAATESRPGGLIDPGDTVLFQGDSITDSGRTRAKDPAPNSQPQLGNGYAWLAAAGLLVGRPQDELRIHNRGISGNKVHQLAERWDADCLELDPDVLSILIGVNDIWHQRAGYYDGDAEVYERDYDALLKRTRVALPNTKLVVCEPFVLRCGAVDDSWFPDFDHYRAAARRVADAHGATFVAFHAMFAEATKYAPPEHWAGDGVHPSAAGSALMAQAWLRAVHG